MNFLLSGDYSPHIPNHDTHPCVSASHTGQTADFTGSTVRKTKRRTKNGGLKHPLRRGEHDVNEKDGIGLRLIHIRGRLSQAAFAAKCGIHKNTLGHYERNERGPDACFLTALAYMGVNINWILTGTGPTHVKAITADCLDAELLRDIERHMHAVIEAEGLDWPPEQKANCVSRLYEYIVREGITSQDERAKVIRLVVSNDG